jgi:hypothetical protein
MEQDRKAAEAEELLIRRMPWQTMDSRAGGSSDEVWT